MGELAKKREVEPPPADAEKEGTRRPASGPILVLGLNALSVLAWLPLLLSDTSNGWSAVVVLIPALPLGLGLAWLGRGHAAAPWVLLLVFPVTLVGAVGAIDGLAGRSPHGPLGLLLGVLSLVAYGAVVARAVARTEPLRETEKKSLGSASPAEEDVQRTIARRVVLSAATLGALAIGVVAPALGNPTALAEAWGPAAAEAALLTAVFGCVIATTLMALFVAPMTRRSRKRPPTRAQVRLRVVLLLLLVVAGTFVYQVVQRGVPPTALL